jgi:hypothetical protein
MDPERQILRLASILRHIGSLHTEFEKFPTGALFLNVQIADRFFVLHYTPTLAFEVDEAEDDSMFSAARYRYNDFRPARRKLMELLKAAKADASH